MTTRMLFDTESVFGDVVDMYDAAVDGERWTDIWPCDLLTIEVGDRVFLIEPEEGIFASGVVVTVNSDDYDTLEEVEGASVSDAYLLNPFDADEPYFVQIELDAVVPYDAPLTWDMLQESEALMDVDWTFELSGEEIDDTIAIAIEARWDDYIDRVGIRL